MSDDPSDLYSLLRVGEGITTPTGSCKKDDVYRRSWRHVHYLADQFWLWIREYLPTIQLRTKWIDKMRNVQIGDIVLVINEITPRRNWPLGRIVNTFLDKDGLVGAVKVKTSKNTYVRPINKICLLESGSM